MPVRRGGRRPAPTPRSTSPLQAASPAPRSPDRACGCGRYRRWCIPNCHRRRRPGNAPRLRSVSASPTARCAPAAAAPAPAGAPATVRDGSRACCRRARESRRRSLYAWSRACAVRIPNRAGYRAIPAWSRRYAAAAGACARAPPAAYRRCAPRCGFPRPAVRSARARRGCRRSALPGSDGCRSTAPSAATHRPPRFHRARRDRRRAAPDRRSPRETPQASCRNRSAPRSTRGDQTGSPATPASAPRWVRGMWCGTRRRRRGGRFSGACSGCAVKRVSTKTDTQSAA